MVAIRLQTGYSSIASMISRLMVVTVVSLLAHSMALAGEPGQSLKEAADGLRTNAEEMVAHGGMGDAKAIIHHCAETAQYAELLIKQLSTSHPGREEGVASLQDVIRHCKRVSEIGSHADPGVLLNPAIKARTAARASVKALGLAK
jgi:nucleotide-binding universal stress UspA family protein